MSDPSAPNWSDDPAVLDEIELYGDLVIAAGQSDRPLSQAEIDAVLGVDPPPQP